MFCSGCTALSGLSGMSGLVVSAASGPLLSDTFTDPDMTTLQSHTMNVGPGWTVVSNGFTISSNVLHAVGSPSVAFCDAGIADLTVSATLTTVTGSSNNVGIIVRYQDVNNYWLFWQTLSSGWVLYDCNGGAFTERAAGGSSSADTAYVCSVVTSGNNFTGKVDGVTVVAYTSSFLNDKTKVGFQSNDVLNIIDNFLVTA